MWSYYPLGEAARKSAYVQRGVVQLLSPDLPSEARMYGGKVCDEPVVGVKFAGVNQVVPLSWIVDKVDAQVGLTDAAEKIERILAPLKQQIQSVLAQKGGQGAGSERRALAMAVGTATVASTSPRASAAGQRLDSGGLTGTEPIALQAENVTLKQRVLVAEQEARDALEREKAAEARSKHSERLRREVDELNASLEQQIDLEQQVPASLLLPVCCVSACAHGVGVSASLDTHMHACRCAKARAARVDITSCDDVMCAHSRHERRL